jgi:hypothetical protein
MKSKFAGLAEARLRDIEAAGEPGIEETAAPVSAPASRPKVQKKAVKQVAKPASAKTRKPDIGKSGKSVEAKRTGKPAGTSSLSINVPTEKRHWWNIQALLQGTTVTDAVIEAMDKRFGLPKKVQLK